MGKQLLPFLIGLLLFQSVKAFDKLPHEVLYKIVSQTDKFILNSSTRFAHVDLPTSKYQQFFGYIKDSSALPIVGAVNPIYYKWYLLDGTEVNGDLFFKGNDSYMRFKIDQNIYINLFTKEGVDYLKEIFKF